jgi:hypothetical protein
MEKTNYGDFLIGVLISVAASFVSSLGVNMQALGLKVERQHNIATESPLLGHSSEVHLETDVCPDRYWYFLNFTY